MITIILSIAFAVFGYFITAGRMKNPRLCVLAPPMVLARMAMVALSLTSETFFLAICFAEGLINPFFFTLGFTVSGFRAVNMLPTAFVLFAVFGGQYSCTAKYKMCFDKDFFLETIYPYAILSFVAMLDCSLIFLFPWRYSEFAFLAKG